MIHQAKHFRYFICMVLVVAVLIPTACANKTAVPSTSDTPQETLSTQPTKAVENTHNGADPAGLALNPTTDTAVSYSKDIAPIFQNSCLSCHGGEKTSKGLDMKTYKNLIAGSQNGAVLIPGDPLGSKLIQSVQSGKMPKRGTKLTSDQIQLLVDWIADGAQNN